MIQSLLAHFAAGCTPKGGDFLFFPHWYKYLDGKVGVDGQCLPAITGINDTWLIIAAVIEIMLRVAAIVAVAFVIYGGILYATSQGSPEKTGQAKSTIINAIVGLAIAVSAAAIISFIAKSIS